MLLELEEKVVSSLLRWTWVSTVREDGCFSLVENVLHFVIDRYRPGSSPDPQSFVVMKFAAIMTAALQQNITRGAELPANIVDYAVN
jgi:hypothetical protein